MSFIDKIFPVQSREAEMEETVQKCINAIIDSANDYTVKEQNLIIKAIHARFYKVVSNEAHLLNAELDEYRDVLGLR